MNIPLLVDFEPSIYHQVKFLYTVKNPTYILFDKFCFYSLLNYLT